MKRAQDFHLSYSRTGQPRISVAIGRGKTRALVLNGSFAAMLEDVAERALKADAAVKAAEEVR